jgi:hypothetical protein
MEKEFLPYEQALELKELGFDESCFGYYEPNGELDYIENHILKDFPYLAKNSEWQDLVAAPLYQQAFRWFREEYALDSYIRPNLVIDVPKTYQFVIEDNTDDIWYSTYPEADLARLKKLIEIVKSQNNAK